MKIIELRAENFKRLKAVDIVPGDANVIPVTGRNEAGKTSVLDAIWAALGGGKSFPKMPIRDGEKSAEIFLDLGEYTVTRKFKWNKDGDGVTTALTVQTADGVDIKSPQALLDKLVGDFTFDPAAFLASKNQAEILLSLIDVDINWDEWEAITGTRPLKPGALTDQLTYMNNVRKNRFDDRADVNRDLKKITGAIATELAEIPAAMRGAQPVDIGALLKQRDAAAEAMRDADAAKQRALNIGANLQNISVTLSNLENQIAKERENFTKYTAEFNAAETDAERLYNAVPDTTGIDAQIADAENINRIAARVAAMKTRKAEKEKLELDSEALTETLAAIDAFKVAALAGAALPVPGLTIEGDAVLLNGIPLSQCSHAQKLKVSLAIGMAVNPKLRVLRLTDGEKFDSDSWAIIREMAEKNDFQVWIEKCDESGKIGIMIEAGSVVAENA